MPAARFFLTRHAPGDPLLLLREDATGYWRRTETLRDRAGRLETGPATAARARAIAGVGRACLRPPPALRSRSQWRPGNHT